MAAWHKVSDKLPPLNVPVWLFGKSIPGPYLGERVDTSEGWLWALIYDAPWYGDEGWTCHSSELDDVHPTHWANLIEPPA